MLETNQKLRRMRMDKNELAASREIMDAVSIMVAEGDIKSALAWQSKALNPRKNINGIRIRSWMKNSTGGRFRNALKLLGA